MPLAGSDVLPALSARNASRKMRGSCSLSGDRKTPRKNGSKNPRAGRGQRRGRRGGTCVVESPWWRRRAGAAPPRPASSNRAFCRRDPPRRIGRLVRKTGRRSPAPRPVAPSETPRRHGVAAARRGSAQARTRRRSRGARWPFRLGSPSDSAPDIQRAAPPRGACLRGCRSAQSELLPIRQAAAAGRRRARSWSPSRRALRAGTGAIRAGRSRAARATPRTPRGTRPARSRVAAIRLQGISTSWPRRRRDPSRAHTWNACRRRSKVRGPRGLVAKPRSNT